MAAAERGIWHGQVLARSRSPNRTGLTAWQRDMSGVRPLPWPLRSRGRSGAGELRLDQIVQRTVDVYERLRRGAGAFEQVAVGAQPRELQIAQARLPRAEELAFAANLQVLLCKLEPVSRRNERFQPLDGRVGQLFPRARNQQAVRLFRAAAHPPAQLVER